MSNSIKLLITMVVLLGILFVASLTLVRSIVPDSSANSRRRVDRQGEAKNSGKQKPRQANNSGKQKPRPAKNSGKQKPAKKTPGKG